MSLNTNYKQGGSPGDQSVAKLPRVLILDVSKPGGEGATGQLSKTLFGHWPEEKIVHLYWEANWPWRLYSRGRHELVRMGDLLTICSKFDPQVIYCRPVNYPLSFYQMTLYLLKRLAKPYVVHIMDDWLARLEWYDQELAAVFEDSMTRLLSDAASCLSISKAMSEAYSEKFGPPFQSISNGVEMERFRLQRSGRSRSRWSDSNPFVVRYCGGLDEDMNQDSILTFARVASDMSQSNPIRFEVYTKSHYANTEIRELLDLPGVFVFECVSDGDYPELLRSSDLLLVAYNFDLRSIDYTRYSFANKIPEILASETPVFVIGPKECATVQFVLDEQCGQVVDDPSNIKEALLEIYESESLRENFREVGLRVVENRFRLSAMREKLENVLKEASLKKGTIQADEPWIPAPFWQEDLGGGAFRERVFEAISRIAEEGHRKPRNRCIAYLGRRWSKLDKNSDWSLVKLEPDKNENHKKREMETLERGSEILEKSGREFDEMILCLDDLANNFRFAQQVLKSGLKPKWVYCGFNDALTERQGYNLHQIAAILRRSGYSVVCIEREMNPMQKKRLEWKCVASYPCLLDDIHASGGVVAFRNRHESDEFLELANGQIRESSGRDKAKTEL